MSIDPKNKDLIEYMEAAEAKREKDIPTVPTNVMAEKLANPFLRAGTAKMLGEIRKAKDNF